MASVAAAAPRPNIIYIMADDLGMGDLGCYGQTVIQTPELDRLAGEGMRFTDHYAGTSVCAPTRCSFMTGKHMGHAYIRANSPKYPGGQTPLPADTETLAKMLQRQGYATACIGKWGLGHHYNSGGANKQGFDLFFGYYDQRHAHTYYTDHLFRDDQRVELDGETYSHDLLTAEAIGFIRDNRDGPFFLYLPYCIPHSKWDLKEHGAYADREWDAQTKANAAMITRMDRDIGRIARLLEELGIADDTVVFFTSDNGTHGGAGAKQVFNSAGPYRGIKRSLYEGGIRTPLIAWWPGSIPAGTVSGHPSAFYDMFATFAELSGGEPAAPTDGISFVPTLLGREADQAAHEYLYWEIYEGRQPRQAIRRGNWKAVVNDMRKPDAIELYDLSRDPGETDDLAAAQPDVVAGLRQLMDAAHQPNPFWDKDNKPLFDVAAAKRATGVE